MTRHRPHLVLLGVAVLLAGCGASSPEHSSGGPSASPTKFERPFLAFASCMRSHGVPSYPDPQLTSSGGVKISPGRANPSSPAFKSADAACHRLLPNGGAPAGGASAGQKAQEVKFADCMRAHGVPSFPDPDHDGAFTLPPGLNPQAPAFRRAMGGCQSVRPASLALNQS
jgi:hypothetical protein